MDLVTISFAALMIILCLCLLHFLIEKKCNAESLKDIPGPRAYPIIGNFLDVYGDQGNSIEPHKATRVDLLLCYNNFILNTTYVNLFQ